MGLSRRLTLLCLVLALGTPGAAPVPSEAARVARKHVLILYDEDKDLPGLAQLDRSLRGSFEAELGDGVEFYSESLSLSQFEAASYDRLVAEHYRQKYAKKPLDLIVAVMGPSLDFLVRHGDSVFPGVPIVFCGVDPSTITGLTLRPNITGVLVKREFAPTLDVALRLQPTTRNVFVVGGSSTFDRHLQTLVRRELKPFEDRIDITYLVGLPMNALLPAVSSLPAQSVILYLTVFSDAAGAAFVPHEVVSSIAAAANAPVYVFVDQFVGRGAVGGSVYSLDTHGSQVAGLGLQILRGAAPSSLPIRQLGAQANMFDARQLDRWKLDATRLPPSSVILHRSPSVWQLYRWYILGAIAGLVTQSALIAGLLIVRARQRRAETEGRRQREELAHVLRVTTLGELTSSLSHELSQPLGAILANAQAARRLLDGGASETDVREALGDIAADAERASQIIRRLRALFRKGRGEPIAVDVNVVIENVVALLRADMETKRIVPQLVLGGAVPSVLGDPVLLGQVILNVVVNACAAVAAIEEGPRIITITTGQPKGDRLAIDVRDNGIGVKETELERIFEHFMTTKPQGLGMGLAISRSIVAAHGGRIWATTNPDRGLTIHIELPCAGETVPAEEAAASRSRS
jgi:signal transduction histidine kinase